jgi:hypothetical protein
VGEHRPKAPERLGRDAHAELRNVALQVSPYKIATPLQAYILARREKAAGKTAPHPKCVDRRGTCLKDVERAEFQIGDTAR